MSPPDYREAAMCANCRYRAKNFIGINVRCLKFDYLGALDHVCSDYDEEDLDLEA